MTAEILSVQDEGKKHRVTFQFVDGKQVEGPFVEDRPADEDHQEFAESIIPQPATEKDVAMEAFKSVKEVFERYGAETFDAAIAQVKGEK